VYIRKARPPEATFSEATLIVEALQNINFVYKAIFAK
jgi:hypothetical protein